MVPDYVFRAMRRADLPLVRRWLMLPHVAAWWGEGSEQFALVKSDLDEPTMDQYLVETNGSAFAYLQCYPLSAWNSGFGAQPAGTRGIDVFIGEPAMLGHGAAFIARFVDEQLRNAVPRVVTDPDPANLRAIRAYERAGFERDRLVETPEGPALLMVARRMRLSRRHSHPS